MKKTKASITKTLFKNNIAINVVTKSQWTEIQELLGVTINGDWHSFGSDTCISMESKTKLVYGSIEMYNNLGYEIIYDF